MVLLEAHEVVEPLWVTCDGDRVKILDDGYSWLFILRDAVRHVVTAHCDATGAPVHWYIDVVDDWAIDAIGFPVYFDLFLDVVSTPGGKVELLDAAELQAAFTRGVVTREQRDRAWSEADRIQHELHAGTFEPVVRTREFLEAAKAAAK